MDIRLLHKVFSSTTGICTDTRKVKKDNLFVALKGENFNGNHFAHAALKAGCKYALVDEVMDESDDRFIQVVDCLGALQELAHFHRSKLKCPIIAITGSNGKTTTKELLIEVLSSTYTVGATEGNLNNHIGVPLTLLSFPLDLGIGIVEMGANHQGEIRQLCEIANPKYGLITNIGKAHLEGFGGPEGVKRGKKELLDYLNSHGGKFFLNLKEESLAFLQPEIKKPILFGGVKTPPDTQNASSDPFLTFEWFDGADWVLQKTQLTGLYNLNNALGAIAIGIYFGVDSEKSKRSLEEYKPENNRSEWRKSAKNEIILDAYNANPSSVKEAILNLDKLQLPNAMAILGDMLELGEYADEEHADVVNLLQNRQIETILVGPIYSQVPNSKLQSFPTTEEAKAWIKTNPISKKVILVKGSRGLALEALLDVL
jgi:UDP-N-acetylmuramoyl-tripeptide--D-alanyl-D-alanine ligase